jgi:uncharacterized repeat protein (TIGR01451 family)
MVETPLCKVKDAYEEDDHYTKAVDMPPGGEELSRYFDIASDKDWFKFYSRADSKFSIATFNLDDNVDTVLQLYDSDGVTLLWENDDYEDGSKASRIEFLAPHEGWYYVRAAHFDHVYDPRYELTCGGRYDIVLSQDSLEVVKTVRNSDQEFIVGSIIEYDIVIWNKLNTIQPNVVMTDYIPLNTVYVPGSAKTTQGSISGPDPLVVYARTLQANQRITVTFKVQIVSDAGGPIVNYAITKSDYQRLIAQTPTVATRIVSYTYLPLVMKQHNTSK